MQNIFVTLFKKHKHILSSKAIFVIGMVEEVWVGRLWVGEKVPVEKFLLSSLLKEMEVTATKALKTQIHSSYSGPHYV